MITPKETWMIYADTMDAETQTEGILIKASTNDVMEIDLGLRNRFGCVREIDWMVSADHSAD